LRLHGTKLTYTCDDLFIGGGTKNIRELISWNKQKKITIHDGTKKDNPGNKK
jgi:hypothetical protein